MDKADRQNTFPISAATEDRDNPLLPHFTFGAYVFTYPQHSMTIATNRMEWAVPPQDILCTALELSEYVYS